MRRCLLDRSYDLISIWAVINHILISHDASIRGPPVASMCCCRTRSKIHIYRSIKTTCKMFSFTLGERSHIRHVVCNCLKLIAIHAPWCLKSLNFPKPQPFTFHHFVNFDWDRAVFHCLIGGPKYWLSSTGTPRLTIQWMAPKAFSVENRYDASIALTYRLMG